MRNRSDPVVINATPLGKHLNGIGVYTLNLLRELPQLNTRLKFLIYVNRSCKEHLKKLAFPENCSLRWVSDLVSPDHGFRGHILRLLYSNYLHLKHPRSLIFGTSQLEAIFFRGKHIITIHDLIPLQFKKSHKRQYYYFKYLLGFVLKRVRAVVTPSKHTKELLKKIYNLSDDRIHVIHHGAPHLPEDESGDPCLERKKFILYVGRIDATKNIPGLLKAFRLIMDQIDHRLVLVGNGKDRWRRDLLAEYEIDRNRIIFEADVTTAKMTHLLKCADLLILPSFYEGFGLPPLEAMASGCPVVVSHVGSLPEICGDAAYYVDPNDICSIAEGIYKVITDDSLRRDLIRNSLQQAKRFDWKESAMEHVKVFEEILDSLPEQTIAWHDVRQIHYVAKV